LKTQRSSGRRERRGGTSLDRLSLPARLPAGESSALVRQHVDRFLEHVEEGSHAPLPDFVRDELSALRSPALLAVVERVGLDGSRGALLDAFRPLAGPRARTRSHATRARPECRQRVLLQGADRLDAVDDPA